MLNNDDRNRLALEAQQRYLDTEVPDSASADWLAAVDHLWQEFQRLTPRPHHDDDLREAGQAPSTFLDNRLADGTPIGPQSDGPPTFCEFCTQHERVATLEGTVSGLRAELAATLRRLDEQRRMTDEAQERTERHWRALTAAQDAHSDTVRRAETAEAAAEHYREDAVASALRLRRVQQALED